MPVSCFLVDDCLPGKPGEDQEVDKLWKQELS